jgi:putative endonuclease
MDPRDLAGAPTGIDRQRQKQSVGGSPEQIARTESNPAANAVPRALRDVNCVYVLFSDRKKRTYVGVTGNPRMRLGYHNEGLVPSTRYGRPWRILVEMWFDSETAALQFERYLKSGSGKAFMYRHFVPSAARLGRPPHDRVGPASTRLGDKIGM